MVTDQSGTTPTTDSEPERPITREKVFNALALGLIVYFAWDLLPTATSQLILVGLIIVGLLSSRRDNGDLILLMGIWLSVMKINFWVSIGAIGGLKAILFVLLATSFLGLLSEKTDSGQLDRESFLRWPFLGYCLASLNSIIAYWPVSYFYQSLFTLIVFYAFWPLASDRIAQHPRTRAAHFIFITLAVMVVVGTIIWVSFPYWSIF